MLTAILIFLKILLLAAIWVQRRYRFWANLGIPQPPVHFPFGTLDIRRHYVYILDDMYRSFRGKSSYIGNYNAISLSLLVTDLDVVRQIIVKEFRCFEGRGFYHNEKDDPVSANLIYLDGFKWKQFRSAMTPYFSTINMKLLSPVVEKVGEKLRRAIERKLEKGDSCLDIQDLFMRFSTDIIGKCALGLDCDSLGDPTEEFRQIGIKVFEEPAVFTVSRFLKLMFPNVSRRLGLREFHPEINSFFMQRVRECLERKRCSDFTEIFVDAQQKLKEGFSVEKVAAQSFAFFQAGVETSSSLSTFTLFEVARAEKVQEKLRRHILEVLEAHGGNMSFEALKDMTFLDQCMSEALRLYPAIPILNRQVTQPFRLPGTDVVLEPGIRVAVPIYSIHRDPYYFPDPETFNPERFSPSERPHCAYMPFGDGPKRCIGERFGILQSKIGLVQVLANFKVSLHPNLKPVEFKKESFVLSPRERIIFNVERVNKA